MSLNWVKKAVPGYTDGVPSLSWEQIRVSQDGRKDTVLVVWGPPSQPLKNVQNMLQDI